jgi:hypothetical protein
MRPPFHLTEELAEAMLLTGPAAVTESAKQRCRTDVRIFCEGRADKCAHLVV